MAIQKDPYPKEVSEAIDKFQNSSKKKLYMRVDTRKDRITQTAGRIFKECVYVYYLLCKKDEKIEVIHFKSAEDRESFIDKLPFQKA